ncbi:MAG: hypothetical protein ACRCVN_06740 [Spirochaetia bacterium]
MRRIPTTVELEKKRRLRVGALGLILRGRFGGDFLRSVFSGS